MRLNNKGWGLRQMLFISSLLLITLLVVAYYVYALYNQLDIGDAKQYANLESKLEIAALRYDTVNATSDNYQVNLSQLKVLGYISDFTDDSGYDCDGYVLVNGEDYNAYISCRNYSTSGYNK